MSLDFCGQMLGLSNCVLDICRVGHMSLNLFPALYNPQSRFRWTSKSDLSSTTKCDQNYISHTYKFGHTKSSSQAWASCSTNRPQLPKILPQDVYAFSPRWIDIYSLTREPLLKRKAQYCWPPCLYSLFCKKKIIFSVLKAANLS
jgi:hypothetical protein